MDSGRFAEQDDRNTSSASSRSIPSPAEPLNRWIMPLWFIAGATFSAVVAWWWQRRLPK